MWYRFDVPIVSIWFYQNFANGSVRIDIIAKSSRPSGSLFADFEYNAMIRHVS